MMGLCARWTTLLPEAEAVSAEAAEEIRAAIGQADLLIRKKLIKFMDLCTAAQQPGTTTTAADLEGYWEACVVPPIAEVDARFDKCDDLKGQGWQPTPRQPEPPAPRKRSIKLASRKARNSAGSSTGAGAPAAAAAAPKARSSTLSFLAEARERRRLALLQQSSEQQDIDVVVAVPIKRHAQPMDMEDACAEPMARRALPVSSGSGCSAGASRTSFGGIVVPHGNVLLTPVRPPKHEASEPAGEVYVTPVRRSARKVRL